MRETDINSNVIANNMKYHYTSIVGEIEQTLMAQHGPEWVSKVGYEQLQSMHDQAEERAIRMTVQDPDSGFLQLLENPQARRRLLGSPTSREFLRKGLGDAELARLDGLNATADQQIASDVTAVRDALYGN